MKKGFTLIELLGVIVVLGIIGLLVTPIIQSTLKENSMKSCEAQIESFKRAARNYTSQNPYKTYGDVTLKELQLAGFLREGEIKNPRGGVFDLESKVIITKNGSTGTYTYEYTAVNCRS